MTGSDVARANVRWRKPAERLMPWMLFAALLAWGWRTTDLFHTVPSYGDVLEGLWPFRDSVAAYIHCQR